MGKEQRCCQYEQQSRPIRMQISEGVPQLDEITGETRKSGYSEAEENPLGRSCVLGLAEIQRMSFEPPFLNAGDFLKEAQK
jgi:hypothetical protein